VAVSSATDGPVRMSDQMTSEMTTAGAARAREELRVSVEGLRWKCDPAVFGVPSTAELDPLAGIIGQEDAVEALRFGLAIHAPGQHVFVRGLTGTGRLRAVKQLLGEVEVTSPEPLDRCYVHNFEHPNRPTLVTLPRGDGRRFRERIDELIAYIRDELLPALSSDSMKARRQSIEQRLKAAVEGLTDPFQAELASNELTTVMVNTPGGPQTVLLPLIDGEPAPPDRLQQLVAEGKLKESDLEAKRAKAEEFAGRFEDLNESLHALREDYRKEMRDLIEGEARALLSSSVREIRDKFRCPGVRRFLRGIVDDVVSHHLQALSEGKDFTRRYRVNVLVSHDPAAPRPVLVETQPSLKNLMGTIERHVLASGGVVSDHLMVQAGSILRADGGFLILEARDLLSEPGAWHVLVRTLRTGQLEISPQESLLFGSSATLTPEPIPIDLKVVLIGDPGLHAALDAYDPDFPNLFKVLSDFDTSLPLGEESLRGYAGVIAYMVREEGLPHFSAGGLARLCEHGARVAARNDRLTTRFGRLGDLARESSFLARQAGRELVEREDVHQAIRRSRRRGDLPARRFRELIADGTIRIQTSGRTVGQVNGLAVTQAGPLTYGFPARITATIGPGHGGTINIEREAQLSGSIHTKGFYILGGLLRHLMRGAGHPLAFSASIAFEQSYGGIDGDSASAAEMCCLLSALTGVPLRQGVAMTGAIDQLGHVQPIGAATEKIEGFFDVCSDAGLSGEQGVIIPRGNLSHLMLRSEVVEACAAGRFHVWAVETIGQALELFTDCDAGELGEDGEYPSGTLFARAVQQAGIYWGMAGGTAPPELEPGEPDEAEEAGDEEAEGPQAEARGPGIP